MPESIEHSYTCPRCGGGGEEHYLTLIDDEEAPDTIECHGDECEHDPACASDDNDRMRKSKDA